MNKFLSNIRRRTFFVILFLLIGFAGFSLLPKSAEMKRDSESVGQVTSPLKKLTVGKAIGHGTLISSFLDTYNADGTGGQTILSFLVNNTGQLLGSSGIFQEPDWSPDGTQIVYSTSQAIIKIGANGENPTLLTSNANLKNPSWSITDKIAYERDDEIWTMNSDGTEQALFSGITQSVPKDPKWSPDGSNLAFTSSGEVWVINADGSNERQITNNSTDDMEPDWSPTGTKLVYQKGSTGIAVINLDGTNETNLTDGVDDQKPAWSNDGVNIAFVRKESEANGIYVMDATGANQVRILISDFRLIPPFSVRGRGFSDPAWKPVDLEPNTFTISGRVTRAGVNLSNVVINLSGTTNAAATIDAIGNYQFSNLPVGGNYMLSPSFTNHFFTPANRIYNNLSGDRIADFTAAETCSTPTCITNGRIAYDGISTMNSDGSDKIFLSNGKEPNYSWDGSKIVFASDRDGNWEIYEMNADGSSVVRLTNNAAADNYPAYSPDGQSIVFHSNRDGDTEIYKMNADGTNQVRLTNSAGFDWFPSYSPDGGKIVFVRFIVNNSIKLYTMNPDGSNQTALPTPGGFYAGPTYSYDGTKIIVGRGPSEAGIHTMNPDGTNFTLLSPRGYERTVYSPDGKKIVYRDVVNSSTYLYTANANGTSPVQITSANEGSLPVWQPIRSPRRVMFDFDGDERADISVFRPSDRIWYLLRSQAGFSSTQFGLSDDNLTPADYDGDLKTDIAVWRASEEKFYIANSSNGTLTIEDFGLAGDIPTVGDWDGDGKADLSVYRGGTQGVFYYRASSNNPNGNISNIPWGISGDKPVSGDFDGDGQMDAAVFRPSNGVWYIRKSSDGQLLAYNFGLASDKLVPADYDGDVKTDIAVYRNGVWYILRSSDGGVSIVQFGVSTDVPTPADYDGDGKADIAIFRDGIWYILQTSNGNANILQFGLAADKPLPASFIQ